jgi:hypothetical protein
MIGATALRAELKALGVCPLPTGRATIERVLKRNGLIASQVRLPRYCPVTSIPARMPGPPTTGRKFRSSPEIGTSDRACSTRSAIYHPCLNRIAGPVTVAARESRGGRSSTAVHGPARSADQRNGGVKRNRPGAAQLSGQRWEEESTSEDRPMAATWQGSRRGEAFSRSRVSRACLAYGPIPDTRSAEAGSITVLPSMPAHPLAEKPLGASLSLRAFARFLSKAPSPRVARRSQERSPAIALL